MTSLHNLGRLPLDTATAWPRLAEYLPEANLPRPISRETVALSNPIRTAIEDWVSLTASPASIAHRSSNESRLPLPALRP